MERVEREFKAKLTRAREISNKTYELRFDLVTEGFEFKAGQYVWINIPKLLYGDPRGTRRAFSIASSPNDRGSLEIIFRLSDSGFKKTLIDKRSIGSEVEVIGPFGFLGLPDDVETPLVFVAGGMGVAPFVSMVRYATENKLDYKITLIFFNSGQETSFYIDLFEDLEKKNSNFKFCDQLGSFSAAAFRKCVKDFKDNLYFVTGPKGFVVNASIQIRSLGVPQKNFIFNEFNGFSLDGNAKTEVATTGNGDGEGITLEEFYTAVVDVADHIIMTDENGFIRYANPAAEKITGYTFAEMRGNTPRLWGGMMDKEFYKKLWKTIKIDKRMFEGEFTNRRKDGRIYYAIARISPVLDSHGDLTGFVSTEEDITKIKELDKIKDEFLSLASHELRTPLTAIDGIVAMIKDGEYGEINKEVRLALDDVSLASTRLIKLVNDLLSLSRIQAGRLKYNLTVFDVGTSVKRIIDLLNPAANEAGLEIKLIGEDTRIFVQADQDKVEQILTNLIGNGLKFTPKGSISITIIEEKDVVKIFISDTGIGIEKKNQGILFGKFQQITARGGKTQGTGLGLHLSREMIRKMGGDLWLEESEPGKGSVFAFSLPKNESTLAKKAAEEIAKEVLEHPDQKYDIMKKA